MRCVELLRAARMHDSHRLNARCRSSGIASTWSALRTFGVDRAGQRGFAALHARRQHADLGQTAIGLAVLPSFNEPDFASCWTVRPGK